MDQHHDNLDGTHQVPDCEAALAEVYTYLDEELTPVSQAAILRHLELCGPCFKAFDFEAELRVVIAIKAQSGEVPEILRVRISEKIALLRTEGGSGEVGGQPPTEA